MAVANSINSGQLLDISASPTFNTVKVTIGTASQGLFTDSLKNLTTTGTLGFPQGGFGFTTATTGDLFLATGTNIPGKLSAVAVGRVLVSNGTGAVPVWSTSPTLTALTLPGASALTFSAAASSVLTITSSSGVANRADIVLARNDSTNGNNRILYLTAGASKWSVGARSGSENYVVFDEVNGLAQLTMATGATTTGTSTFAGSVIANAFNSSVFTASKAVFTSGTKDLTTTGILGVDQGGTGTGTTFTLGSVVFKGASGIDAQDNANFFYDATGHNMYIGCNSSTTLAVTGKLNILGTVPGITGSTYWFGSGDQYPLLQLLPFSHDNVSLNFDAYFDASNWKSSSVNSNFQIIKGTSNLIFSYSTGNSQGGTVTWSTSFALDQFGNLGLGGIPSPGGGKPVFFVLNAVTVPTTNPSGGGILYAQAGAGKWRGSSGTVTTFGPAEPHCPICDSDFGLEWENENYGGTLRVCMKCFSEDMGNKPYVRWNEQ